MSTIQQPSPVTDAAPSTDRGHRLRGLLVALTLGVGAMLAPPQGRVSTRPGVYRLIDAADDRFDPRERVAGLVLTTPLVLDERSAMTPGRASLN